MAQRLVRKMCMKCKTEYKPDVGKLLVAGMKKEDIEKYTFYHGTGCGTCRNTGYYGRTGIFEMFEMNTKLRELAFNREPTSVIRRQARLSGMLTLLEDGVRKLLDGITTVEEVVSVATRYEEIEMAESA